MRGMDIVAVALALLAFLALYESIRPSAVSSQVDSTVATMPTAKPTASATSARRTSRPRLSTMPAQIAASARTRDRRSWRRSRGSPSPAAPRRPRASSRSKTGADRHLRATRPHACARAPPPTRPRPHLPRSELLRDVGHARQGEVDGLDSDRPAVLQPELTKFREHLTGGLSRDIGQDEVALRLMPGTGQHHEVRHTRMPRQELTSPVRAVVWSDQAQMQHRPTYRRPQARTSVAIQGSAMKLTCRSACRPVRRGTVRCRNLARLAAGPTASRRPSAEAEAPGNRDRGLDPAGDEALIVDVVRGAAERAAHRLIGPCRSSISSSARSRPRAPHHHDAV
jgi:hypothetical protein